MVPDGILKYAVKRSHFKVRQMIGRHGFTASDFGDLWQELMLDVLKRLPKFKGDRAGIKTFICRVIDNRIASLIKHHEAGCRDHRRVECSLEDWVHGEGGRWTSPGKTITEDEALARRSGARRSRQEQIDLKLDIPMVLEMLPSDDRDLCLRLRVKTVLEISRETGVPRGRIYARMKALYPTLLRAGMRDYL